VAFDDARYLGEPGLCPMCHLSVVELTGTSVLCATCGSAGDLRADGAVRWTDLSSSVLSMAEKRAHAREIQETAAAHGRKKAELEERAAKFGVFEHVARP
jgi:uncharacterized Zn finger protein (UPF0148 family)